MRSIHQIVRGIAISATLAMALPGVAYAGQNDRAQQAIAEARGKISAGTVVGAGDEAVGLQTRAKAALNDAENLLSKGKKTEAIAAAQQAGLMADQALAMSNRTKTAAAEVAVTKAQGDAADAKASAAASAQDAAAANTRADMAMATPAPAPTTTTTTVATEEHVVTPAPVVRHSTRHRTVRKTAHRTAKAKPVTVNSTTVTTTQK